MTFIPFSLVRPVGVTAAMVAALLGSGPVQAQSFGIGAILNPEGSRLFPQAVLFPRHPQKPDPRWRGFSWRSIDNNAGKARYRLYFYENEDWTARFAIPRINDEISILSGIFSYSPTQLFSYILFTSQREFRQANVFDITEGVQGITSTEEATMAIPYWGEAQSFDHISTHEMTHQFQVQKIADLAPDSSPRRQREMASFPLWFIEGMAEYYSLKGTLGGMDDESRVYLRDALLNPDPKRIPPIPGFFEEGPFNFTGIYKFGQAKVAFLEKRFGSGTAQRVLESTVKEASGSESFKKAVSGVAGITAEKIESEWLAYLNIFREEANHFTQPASKQEGVKLSELLDYFDISPNGELLVDREIDPMTRISSIQLVDLKNHGELHRLIEDNRPGALSLYFSQAATLSVSDNRVAYVAETAEGPSLEFRSLKREKNGRLQIGRPARVNLYRLKVLEVASVALSPDGKNLALVEILPSGAARVVILEGLTEELLDGQTADTRVKLRALTDDHYSWKDLSWSNEGLLAASDRTSNGRYGIFRLNPVTGETELLSLADQNQFSPSWTPEGILIQSWATGTPQALISSPNSSKRVSSLATGVFHPRMRNGRIYALVFHGGHYRFEQFEPKTYPPAAEESSNHARIPPPSPNLPWKPALAQLDQNAVKHYRPFFSQGSSRLDNLGAFLASGGYFGLAGVMSDLMRDYVISGELLMLGGSGRTSGSIFLSDRKRRGKWTLGVYRELFPMLDNIFEPGPKARTYLQREYGVLGALEYPLDPFSFLDAELRVGNVLRTDFSDSSLNERWLALNPGSELIIAPTLRFGYDRLIYELYSGPLQGFGLLGEAETALFPGRSAISQRLRMDVSNYWHLPGRTVFMLQGMAATSWGDRYRNSFFVSSDDILRAYSFNDERLFGNHLLAAKSELRFPIGSLFGFDPLRGLIGYDLGSIFNRRDELGTKMSASASVGITLNLPPLSINFVISKPLREAPGPMDASVGHFLLRYLYL